MNYTTKRISKAVFILMVLWVNMAKAQDMPKVIPPSPSTQQFEKYGNYPVSNFTGIPDINIPIYTIQEGDLTVPITLNYHASGTKPTDMSGLVGMGWTINTGGKISRTVIDQPDEKRPFPTTFYTTDGLISMTPTYMRNYYLKQIESLNDVEPDIFSYNFCGYQGKFILKPDANKTPMLLPYKALDIKDPITDPSRNLNFNITDEHGIRYKFFSSEFASISGIMDPAPTGWDLTSITSAIDTNNKITFTAQSGPFEINNNKRIDQWAADDQPDAYEVIRGCYLSRSDATPVGYFQASLPTTDFMEYTVPDCSGIGESINYSTTYPYQIFFRSGKIELTPFTSDDHLKSMLQKITIYDHSNNVLRSLEFNYLDKAIDRVLLKEIKLYDRQHNYIGSYKFDYFNEEAVLPFSSGGGVDWWGYYNNAYVGSQNALFPPWTISFPESQRPTVTMGTGDRATNVGAMETYVLYKIAYPTGGYTLFDFEANKLPGRSSELEIPYYGDRKDVGGLRIKSITNYKSADATPEVKTYEYSPGYMDFKPGYKDDYSYSEVHFLTTFEIGENAGGWNGWRRRYFRSEPTFNMTPHGSPVVYDHVTEYIGDGIINTGKIVYDYDYTPAEVTSYPTNGETTPIFNDPISYRKYLKQCKDWMSGNLIGKTYFRNTEDNYSEIKKESYNYVNTPIDTVRGFIRDRYVFYDSDQCTTIPQGTNPDDYIPNIYNGYYCLTAYPYNFGDYYITTDYHHLKSTEIDVFGMTGEAVVTTTNYEYSNPTHDQVTTKTVSTSTGDNLITRYKYPHDFAGTQPYTDMVNTYHIWNPVVERLDYKNVEDSGHFLQSTKTDYSTWNSNAAQIYPATVSTKKGAGSYESRIQYQAYDGQGNVASVSKAGGPKVNYIWGYGGAYPVAQVNNADYTAIVTALGGQSAVDAFRNTPIPLDVDVNTFLAPLRNVANLPNAQVTTYTYDPLVGMTSMTDPRGNKTTYEYDNFQRLINVKDQNGNIKTRYCYNYAGASVGCLVAATPIPPDPIPDPPVGIYVRIEITDVGYEYYGDETEYSSYQTGNVCIKLYSDPACTIPLTLSYDLPVVMDLSDDILDDVNGNSTEPSYATYTITAGNNSYCLGSMDLDDLYHYQDEFGNPHYQEFIYHYDLVPGSTVYRNKPAVTF